MTTVRLSNLIAPSFREVHNDIKQDKYTHYWLKGGRGSTKSTFVAVEILLGMMKDPEANALVMRKYGTSLRESVFAQMLWAINKLKVTAYWKASVSPMQLVYIPTGQKVLFRGVDDPSKAKSTKVSKGYIKYVWYEEADEFKGQEEIDTINQTLLRGGPTFTVFYTFNPPKSVRSWVNQVAPRLDAIHHHSTYLTVPRDWLGETFLAEAEHLMQVNPERYKHEFLGTVTGTGGEVFSNVTIREITDQEIREFEIINRGIDWGYAADPFVYTENNYDKKKEKLFIFFEYYAVGAKFNRIAEIISKQNKGNKMVTADNEPRSNAELRDRGLRVSKAKKGPDSRDHGFTWLQNLTEIVIDPVRCPNTAREFTSYELEKDNNGNWKPDFPDGNDHTIDATRYSLERYIRGANFIIPKRRG